MRKVFNLGIGFVFIVPGDKRDEMTALLASLGEKGYIIGEVA